MVLEHSALCRFSDAGDDDDDLVETSMHGQTKGSPTTSQKHEHIVELTGVRHSRRLAALAEAEPLPQSSTQAQRTTDPGASSAQCGIHEGQTADPGAVPAQHSVDQQGPKASGTSPVLLGAATLEASANVLKGLVSNRRLQV